LEQPWDTATVANTKQKSKLLGIDGSNIPHPSDGLADPFLQDLSAGQKHRILDSFAKAVREGRFSAASRTEPLASGTVRATMDSVGQTIKTYDLPDPRLNGKNNTSFILLRQYKGYVNLYPGENQQQAITGSVLKKICRLTTTPLIIAMSQLLVAAFLFTMGSCEYLSVNGDRRINFLCLRNIHFFLGRKQLKHSDPRLTLADKVSISFKYQKHEELDEMVTQKSTGDPLLCPVMIIGAEGSGVPIHD
jgi:hypothetical protein